MNRRSCLALPLALLLAATLCAQAQPNIGAAAPREHHRLVRVHLESAAQLQMMFDLGATPWNCITGVGTMEFSLAPEAFARLQKSAVAHEVINDDVQLLIDAERARIAASNQNQGGIAGGPGWFTDFKTWPQVNAYIDDLVALRPDLATKVTVGATHQGRTIFGLRITGPGTNKPAVLYTGCQHAREWIAVMVPMFVADALVRRYDTDPQIHALVDAVEFFVIPIVNPDGFEHTYAPGGDRLWRKNRRNNGNGTFGVDLNRNWSFAWGEGDSNSTSTSSDVYIGPEAFSEPETQAVRDFILAHPQIAAHIDFHSYGQLVLQSWAHTNLLPAEVDLVDSIGTRMNEQVFAAHAMNYSNGWGGTLLYLADGVFPDWCFGEHGIYSFTIELRDRGMTGFILPADQIIPTCEEALPAALELAKWIGQNFEFFFPRGLPAAQVAGAGAVFGFEIQPILDVGIMPNSAELFTRNGAAGPFQASALTSIDSTHFQATLPPADCGEIIQYYIRIQGDNGVHYHSPANAPAAVSEIKAANVLGSYDFQTAAGWASQDGPSTAGRWQRGVPVNDSNWPYDPSADADASGQCWVTQNTIPNNDVDATIVRLVSPALEWSNLSGELVLEYAYFLHLTHAGPADGLTLEVSSNDLTGPWISLARHSTSAGAHWRRNRIEQADLAQAGVALTSTMRLRFSANDAGLNSMVEAGVDAVRIFTDCPQPLCPADIAGNDGVVNVNDLLLVIGNWGATVPPANVADINGDHVVNVNDLLAVIGAWGPCP